MTDRHKQSKAPFGRHLHEVLPPAARVFDRLAAQYWGKLVMSRIRHRRSPHPAQPNIGLTLPVDRCGCRIGLTPKPAVLQAYISAPQNSGSMATGSGCCCPSETAAYSGTSAATKTAAGESVVGRCCAAAAATEAASGNLSSVSGIHGGLPATLPSKTGGRITCDFACGGSPYRRAVPRKASTPIQLAS
jgi:hypothetical protein